MIDKTYQQLHKHYLIAEQYAREHDSEMIMTCLRGSQNYGLADTYSDVDTVSFVLPSKRALVFDDKISKEIITEDKEHCIIKDVRYLYYELVKGSPNMIEALMTDYYFSNPKYQFFIKEVRGNREHYARLDPIRTIKAMAGMAFSKTGKNYHLERNLEMIERYIVSCNGYIHNKHFETYKAILISNKLDHLKEIKKTNYRDPEAEDVIKSLADMDWDFEENTYWIDKLKNVIIDLFTYEDNYIF